MDDMLEWIRRFQIQQPPMTPGAVGIAPGQSVYGVQGDPGKAQGGADIRFDEATGLYEEFNPYTGAKMRDVGADEDVFAAKKGGFPIQHTAPLMPLRDTIGPQVMDRQKAEVLRKMFPTMHGLEDYDKATAEYPDSRGITGKPPLSQEPFPGKPFPSESGDKSTTTPQPAIDPVAKAVNGTSPMGNDQDYRARVAKIMQADRLGRAMQAGEGAMSDALKLILTTGSAIRTGAPPVPQLRGDSAGEAMTGRTAMQMRALENEENRELKKSQIESNNAYRQSMQEGINRRSDQNKLITAAKEYRSIAKKKEEAMGDVRRIRAAIKSGAEIAINQIPLLLQKAGGDSGNIAISEQQANAGRASLYHKFQDRFTKLATGQMTEGWKQDVLQLVAEYEKANADYVNEKADEIALSYSYVLGVPPDELKSRLLQPGRGLVGGNESQTTGGEMSIRNKSTGTVFPATSQQYQDLLGRFGADAFEEVR